MVFVRCQKNAPSFALLISESETMKPADKSRYFVGLTTPVLFVAFLSLLAFIGVVFGASAIAGLHAFFFLVLPLASTGVGAYLIAAPETTVFGSDPTVTLLLRAAGALSIAYAGGALLVGRSSCITMKTMHLVVTAAVTGTIAAVFASDEGSVVAAEVSTKAAGILGLMSLAATASAAMTAAGPTLIKKIQWGKASESLDKTEKRLKKTKKRLH